VSWKLTGIVSTRVCGGPIRKIMLMTLASYANDDGAGVFASFATMADACEIDRKTAKRVLQAFEAEGLAVKVGARECRNGWTNEYALSVSAIEALPAIKKTTGGDTPPVRKAPGAHVPDLGHTAPTTGGTPPPKPVIQTSRTPSLRSGGASTRKQLASDHTLPSEITAAMSAFAAEHGFGASDALRIFGAWRDHHISRATPIADATASFRTWVRNEIKFTRGKGYGADRQASARVLDGDIFSGLASEFEKRGA